MLKLCLVFDVACIAVACNVVAMLLVLSSVVTFIMFAAVLMLEPRWVAVGQ